MLGSIVGELVAELRSRLGRPMLIVETGTIRDPELLPEPGADPSIEERSTLRIAQAMKEGDSFYSIDSSPDHIAISCQVLVAAGLADRVEHVCGDSREMLKKVPCGIHFALLDSDSNADVTLAEFQIVLERVNSDAIIVVDDAFKPRQVNKARLIMPLVRHYNLRTHAIGVAIGPIARDILSDFK